MGSFKAPLLTSPSPYSHRMPTKRALNKKKKEGALGFTHAALNMEHPLGGSWRFCEIKSPAPIWDFQR